MLCNGFPNDTGPNTRKHVRTLDGGQEVLDRLTVELDGPGIVSFLVFCYCFTHQ